MHRFDWQTRSFGIFLLAYIAIAPQLIYLLSASKSNELAWLYLGLLTAWLLLGALASLLLSAKPQTFFHVCHILVNIFFLPMTFFVIGYSPTVASLLGIAYVMLLVMLVPRWIGLAAVGAGIVLAIVHEYILFNTGSSIGDNFWFALAYAGLAVIAYLWRLLVQKLAEALSPSPIEIDRKAITEQLEALQRRNQLLKQEVAQHIIEMRKLTAKLKTS